MSCYGEELQCLDRKRAADAHYSGYKPAFRITYDKRCAEKEKCKSSIDLLWQEVVRPHADRCYR